MLIYITCSILPEENDDQIAAFRAAFPGFIVADAAAVWQAAFTTEFRQVLQPRAMALP